MTTPGWLILHRSSFFAASVVISTVLIFSPQLALAQAQQGPMLFTQQGPKLVGTGAVGDPREGYCVGMSDDGSTAIIGGNSVVF